MSILPRTATTTKFYYSACELTRLWDVSALRRLDITRALFKPESDKMRKSGPARAARSRNDEISLAGIFS